MKNHQKWNGVNPENCQSEKIMGLKFCTHTVIFHWYHRHNQYIYVAKGWCTDISTKYTIYGIHWPVDSCSKRDIHFSEQTNEFSKSSIG